MDLETLDPTHPGDVTLSSELLAEATALYASNRDFFARSGDFPDPDHIDEAQVAEALHEELAEPGTRLHLAREHGTLVGLAVTLRHHPVDAADPDPWIGLLLIAAAHQRAGLGRQLATALEDTFRTEGRTACRLAVLENNPPAMLFWASLGYTELRRGKDLALGRASVVLRKVL